MSEYRACRACLLQGAEFCRRCCCRAPRGWRAGRDVEIALNEFRSQDIGRYRPRIRICWRPCRPVVLHELDKPDRGRPGKPAYTDCHIVGLIFAARAAGEGRAKSKPQELPGIFSEFHTDLSFVYSLLMRIVYTLLTSDVANATKSADTRKLRLKHRACGGIFLESLSCML